MAVTFEELRDALAAEGLSFFEDPRSARFLLGMSGMFGKYEVVISLIEDGQFLQFRTVNYLECPAGHENLPALLRVVAELDFQLRLVKFGWDPSDGEVMAYADIWLMDAKLSQQQLNRMLATFMPAIDINSRRFRETIEKGKDPGELTPQEAVGDLPDDPSLPDELRELLEKLKGEGPEDPEPEVDELETI